MLVAAVATLTLAGVLGARLVLTGSEQRTMAGWPGSGVVGVPDEVEIGGPFSLVDHRGRAVTDQDFRGRFMLIFFGYTFCPDICPTELQTVADAIDRMGPAGKKVAPIFVSVDPERDTVAVLKDYVRNFHPRLVGLTGTVEQVARAAKAYRVYYAKTPAPAIRLGGGRVEGGEADYLMSHSSFLYLVGPDGRLRLLLRGGQSAEDIARLVTRATKGT